MRKLILLLFTGILLFSCTAAGADEGRILRFIYCSDVHYGLEREFRGKEMGSDEVSRAMLQPSNCFLKLGCRKIVGWAQE